MLVPASEAFYLLDSTTRIENKPIVVPFGYTGLPNNILDISWIELMVNTITN